MTSATMTLTGVLCPPLAIGIGLFALTSTLVDIGTRLANPIEAEILSKYFAEHWQDILLHTITGIAVSAGISLAVSKFVPDLRVRVYSAIANRVEKISPRLAMKIRDEVGIVVGKPIYKSVQARVTLTEDGIHIQVLAGGKFKTVAVYKVPRGTVGVLEDPEIAARIGAVVEELNRLNQAHGGLIQEIISYVEKLARAEGIESAKAFLDSLRSALATGKVRGVLFFGGVDTGTERAFFKFTEEGLLLWSPKKGLVEVSRATDYGVLLEVASNNRDMFALYLLAQKAGLDLDGVANLVAKYYKQYLDYGSVSGVERLGDFTFIFTTETVGDELIPVLRVYYRDSS
jgi:hypothetical protein